MILLDDDNYHVHAFAYAKTWKAFEDRMEEGGLYIISNFYTKEALDSLKPVSCKNLINFSPSTTVEKLEDDDFMIPAHKFEFIDLGDLYGIANSYTNTDFPDYSAVIEEFERVTEIPTMYGDRPIVRFRLTDGRNSHMVTVWGDLAVATNNEYFRVKDKPVIAILASVKLKTFMKWVQFATIPSSKIYLNLDFDAVLSVDESEKWWYTSCINCSEEVTKLEGTFRCPECKKNFLVAAKRYKIMIVAGDDSDSFDFVLLDRAAKRVLGKTATTLISETTKDGTIAGVSSKIKEIVGKSLTLKIRIKHDNVLLKSTVFFASDAYEPSVTSSVSLDPSTSGASASSIGDSNVVDLEKTRDTPGSCKSSSKKIKLVRILLYYNAESIFYKNNHFEFPDHLCRKFDPGFP
ncbi:hypothetical protein ACET3Z_010750 [Daucus carota]